MNQDKASVDEIRNLLNVCDEYFIPALSSTVKLDEYATKIFNLCTNFEAWDESVLIGLVSSYLNDPDRRCGFITNVSVHPNYLKRGIATQLILNCINHGTSLNFERIELEVDNNNEGAKHLYSRLGFETIQNSPEKQRMVYRIIEEDGESKKL